MNSNSVFINNTEQNKEKQNKESKTRKAKQGHKLDRNSLLA